MRKTILCIAALLLLAPALGAQANLFRKAELVVSSEDGLFPAKNIIDGKTSRSSSWMTAPSKGAPHFAEINLSVYVRLDSVVIHTGILPEEMRPEERGKAAGFWCAKNFILQYWDDANWTDLAETNTVENRLDRICFRFKEPVSSFRFRFWCTDGEPIRIREIEGYGREDKSMAAPRLASSAAATGVSEGNGPVTAVISTEKAGKTMKYVGYNQGYLMPGSNAAAWWEYSGVNAARIWADLKTYVDASWMQDFGPVNGPDSFEAAKARFLSDPLRYIPMEKMDAVADREAPSTNTMVLSHALGVMRSLGIEVLIQSSIDRKWYDASWQHRWDLWQRFYCQAFWCAKNGGVEMFALCNEPNHRNAGPMPLDAWVTLSKIAADAADCAIKDVNRLYGTSLRSRFVGPVTAGHNRDWWRRAAAEQATGYLGGKASRDIIDLFSIHSYNLPAAGYKGRIESLDRLLRENHPEGRSIPVIYTETGRWMNAYLIDKEETMDSPSLFTEWAGMYTENMLEGCYGMWAFKFANTASSTYPRGIKSGHHHQWKGRRFAEDAFENLALGAPVSTTAGSGPASVTDGSKSTSLDFKGAGTVEISLGGTVSVGGLAIYTGTEGGEFTAPDRARAFTTELRCDGAWKKIASETNNKYAQVFYTVDPGMKADAVRLSFKDEAGTRLREVKVFGAGTLSTAERSFDVSGAHRTAEVVRLFAKGFKGERPLLKVERSNSDPDLDITASEDPATGNRYVWIVRRGGSDCNINLNLKALGVTGRTPVVCESVSGGSYGEATVLLPAADGRLDFLAGSRSVSLLTIVPEGDAVRKPAAFCTSVRMDGKTERKAPRIEMNARIREANSAAYAGFRLSADEISGARRILLGVHGRSGDERLFRFHVYGFDGCAKVKSWKKAPHLDPAESRITGAGQDVFLAGQMTMAAEAGWHWLDVTDAVRRHVRDGVTFCLLRELREPGDDYDNGRCALLDGQGGDFKPVLQIW